jgi:hypothetical protein
MTPTEKLVKSVLGRDCEKFDFQVAGSSRTGWRKYLLHKPGPAYHAAAQAVVEKSWHALHDHDIRLFVGPGVFRIGPDEYADSCDPDSDPPSYSQVFALPGIEVLDIVEFCRVGSHNALGKPFDSLLDSMRESLPLMNPRGREMFNYTQINADSFRRRYNKQPHGAEPWRAVQRSLSKIMQIAPFAIQFADTAGLHATLLNRVTPQKAKRIGRFILDVNPEAMDLPPERLEELGIPVPMDRKYPDQPDYEAAMTKYISATGEFRMWWD